MKRLMMLLLVGCAALACVLLGFRNVYAPAEIIGKWYSTEDGSEYVFENGIITCDHYGLKLDESNVFSGAYCMSRQKVLLFFDGARGIEPVQELYLVQKPEGKVLCEDRKGAGKIRFSRFPSETLNP